MALTPQFFFLLIKSTSFPDFISEKIISIDKVLAFLQAFELVSSMFTTAQSGIWVGLLVTSLREPRWNTQETLTEFRGLSKHFWVICDSYCNETEQDFFVKELYHLALQFGGYLRFGPIRTTAMYISFFPFRSAGRQRRLIRIDNLAVHLGYSGTSSGSGVQLQLLKSYKNVIGHEESVCWLIGTCRFWSVDQNIFRFRH